VKVLNLSIKKIVLILLVLTCGFSASAQDLIRVSKVENEIRLGKFAGNRNLSVGVKNIAEELLLDMGYDLSPLAKTHVVIRLVFFDIKNIGANVGIMHKDVSLTQIIAVGELYNGDTLIKKTTQKGESKEISTSTLIVAEDGTFNQQTASIALKKVCELIIKDLTK
jgi:hypothetical protein